MNDPYAPPSADLGQVGIEEHSVRYAGFWVRVGAAIIDSILIMLIIFPLMFLFYGGDALIDPDRSFGLVDLLLNVLPVIAVIVFWVYRSATPGKILLSLKIVDADTLGKPSTGRFILRYICYYVSMIPLMIGIIWIAFDKRKQGWHDKIARTVVIQENS